MVSEAKLLSFLAHIEELRWRILQYLVVYVVCCFIAYPLTSKILPFIIGPVGSVVFHAPGEAFSAYMMLTLLEAFIFSSPAFLYQIWAFAWEALTDKERKHIVLFGPFSLILFLAGAAFAFYVVAPFAIKFLFSFSSERVVPMISIKSYISFIGNLLVSFGVVFELPLVLIFLVKIGIATPAFLKHFRRHVILAIFIISAIFTPPDVVSQLLMAVPLVVLYEIGVLCSVFFSKKEREKSA